MAKGFDLSAPIAPLVPAGKTGSLDRGPIELKVNGAVRQTSDLAKMIWSVPETIAYLSGLVRLAPGDLIFTGTPDGVGAVAPGDRMEGRIASLPVLTTRVVG
jgi:fumarylpyruvate hydrolase